MVDFRKAFDLVGHKLLLEKNKCFKRSYHFVSLMESDLNSRSSVTSVNNCLKVVSLNVEPPMISSFFLNIYQSFAPVFVRLDLFKRPLYNYL